MLIVLTTTTTHLLTHPPSHPPPPPTSPPPSPPPPPLPPRAWRSIGETYVPRIVRWWEKLMQSRQDKKARRRAKVKGRAKGVAAEGEINRERDVCPA